MKKFGTPIGAAPGSANENVGLDALGTPLPRRLAGFVDFFFFFGLPLFAEGLLAGFRPPWCEEGCCEVPGPLGFGGVCEVEVEVELDVELELDEEEEEDDDDDDDDDDEADEDDELVDVVVGEVVVVVVLGVHDSFTAVAPAGKPGIADSGVPEGTSRFSETV